MILYLYIYTVLVYTAMRVLLGTDFHSNPFKAFQKNRVTCTLSIPFPFPEDPCMVYIPTFTIKIHQMQVNIPYMDPQGFKHS